VHSFQEPINIIIGIWNCVVVTPFSVFQIMCTLLSSYL